MKNRTFHLVHIVIAMAMVTSQSRAQSSFEPYTFTTLAGGGGFTGADTVGSAARFNDPEGVAVDSSGNVYVADTFNAVIRKVTPAGTVTTLAGLAGSLGFADGTGADARFIPFDVAVDSSGNVYVADGENYIIRKITPAGVVTTLAGEPGVPGSADGTGNQARFREPNGIAVDSAGNVYVADAANNTIRKITAAGVVTTLAGRAGFFGSADGTGSTARFNFPQSVAVDMAGNVYVADSDNSTIRKVTSGGVVSTLAGAPNIPGSTDGAGSAARFGYPQGVAVDSAGNVYVADTENRTVRKVTAQGVVTTLAGRAGHSGSTDGSGAAARFQIPFGVAVDGGGTVYVADSGNDLIRKITPLGEVSTFAGLAGNYGSADGVGLSARFAGPAGVAIDSNGTLYVADRVNQTIRKLTETAVVTTLAGLAGEGGSANGTGDIARFNAPFGAAVDRAGNIYTTAGNTIRKVTPTGVVTTLAGADVQGSADGVGTAARFTIASGLAVDGGTNIYVADTLNSTIRKVTPAGVVTTIAGQAGSFGSDDGTGSTAQFFGPRGVAVDGATNLYVADTWNHTIRKVTPARVVTTLAGSPGTSGSADGPGMTARFNYPSGLAVDSAGNIYVADTFNNAVRKVTPAGVVTTLGGTAGTFGTANGTGSAARFGNPNAVAVDGAGTIYIADFYFNTIRKGVATTTLFNAGFNTNGFGFGLAGPIGRTVVVEASTDSVNWLPIWTNILTPDSAFRDPRSGLYSNRVYRVWVR